MKKNIFINHFPLEAKNFKKVDTGKLSISFEFTVTHEDYHEVTTLLYENDFLVKVPEENLQFAATITKYSTSITNLYEKGAEGEFKLELTEK